MGKVQAGTYCTPKHNLNRGGKSFNTWMRSKRLRRMEEDEVDGLAGCWQRTEAWNIRAGNLKRRLEKVKERVLRLMEVREEDSVITNISY